MSTEVKAKVKNDNAPTAMQDFFMRMGILGELLAFLWKRKLYWLIPLIVTLLVFAVLIIVGSAGPGGAFIYTLF
jgi:hypothetical protein